ncbi:transcriptional regulator, DeoR family [Ignavigranum ruoffiae]|uniref:Transcriptional regulator, DeoR family n=1 Tax=Ignavigranum ruoffiae TaxID=89093 RepID=A0A1H9B7E1_9LACT|nr:DeoR/GlpR family DNA-binding transcription regulator [Ignavigranum ruoffiae]SEP84168.1 transcriptional regulator, DeoR family [Ignavigranum ruoffiae]
MFKQERQKAILYLLEENYKIRIVELANHFHVSTMTIRRDLEVLEKNDYIKRARGWAIANQLVYAEKSFLERRVQRLKEKQAIAIEAYKLISPHDRIILDYGSTPQELAKLMAKQVDFPLTVVINDFNIYQLLRTNSNISLLFAGGNVELDRDPITLGYLTNQFFQHLVVDKAFMSMRTVDFKQGLFHPVGQVAETKRAMINAAKKVIVIADYSKFNNHSMFQIAPIETINILITDTGLDIGQYTIPQNLKVIQAELRNAL